MHHSDLFRITRTAGLVSLALLICSECIAQCEPVWTLFPGGGGSSRIRTSLVFDEDGDGPGLPALFVGGDLHEAGGITVDHIARWDGTTWTAVGIGMDNTVDAIAAFDEDGPGPNPPALFVCGSFLTAGGVPANRIARWDGTSWSAVGSGFNNVAFSMHVYDDDGPGPNPAALYVGGVFTTAGGMPAERLARWDGVSWSEVGGGADAAVAAIAGYDDDGDGPNPPALVIAGSFGFVGGGSVAATRIAKWDGSTWSALGSGILNSFTPNAGVNTLQVFDDDGDGPNPPALIVAGNFDTAGGQETFNIARWTGSDWSAVADGFNLDVVDLLVHDADGDGPGNPVLYAGGRFFQSGGIEMNGVAVLSDSGWLPIGAGVGGSQPIVHALAWFDDDADGPAPALLHAVGSFEFVGLHWADRIARFIGDEWLPLGSGLNYAGGTAFAVRDVDGDGPARPELYLGGFFDVIDDVVVNAVARYDGENWFPVGGGVGGSVRALTIFDPDGPEGDPPSLIVGGAFGEAGGDTSINKIAAWDGTSWTALGSGMSGGTPQASVRALAVWDQDGAGPEPATLFAGGEFTMANGVTVNHVARWTGSTWASLAGGVNDDVFAMAVFDPPGPMPAGLYVGGDFGTAGGNSISRIARWDGVSWTGLGVGLNQGVRSLAAIDIDGPGPGAETLYVGGRFTMAGGNPALRIAGWTGSDWFPLGAGMDDSVHELIRFDFDQGGPAPPALIAAGQFQTADNVAVNYIARWDGTTWAPLGQGVDQNGIGAIAVYFADAQAEDRSGLYISGGFAAVAGESSSHVALWSVTQLAVLEHPSWYATVVDGSAGFSVSAIGNGELAYQWRHEGVPIADGGNISGATTSELTIDPVTPADHGVYDVVVTDTCVSVTSQTARLIVAEQGDVNRDGVVGIEDFIALLAAWGNCPADPTTPCPADIDSDTVVGVLDLLILLGNWTA